MKSIISLSFDDGRLDNYTLMYPIIKKYNIPVTINIATGYIEGVINPSDFDFPEPMSVSMLSQLFHDSNVEIAGHGYMHINEKEDIIQEGMIGLYKAIKNFEDDKQNSFKSFANLCIERQLITAIKTSTRQKHMPLNSSLSLNTPVYENDDDDISLMELFNSKLAEDPLDTITKKEYYKIIGNKIDENLSDFEKQVLTRFAARR